MPNIAIIKTCNLKCPYCFANDMLQEDESKEITIEQLNKILNWIGKIPLQGHIGIIGGEPTLHSNFKEILFTMGEFCNRNNIKTVIFTNGILLYKYIHLLNNNFNLLININKLKENNKKLLLKSLDMCNTLNWFFTNQVTLGCNLYSLNNDYSYFWEIVDRYKGIKQVRMSITAPVVNEDKKDKFLYYNKMKPILLSFLKEAEKRNLKISYDCNQIPSCFFTEEEYKYVKTFGDYQKTCNPVVDITADFKASSCFGSYEDTLTDCKYFNNLNEIESYFSKKMLQKTFCNNDGECKNCQLFTFSQCQGGCLSFAHNGQT